MPPTQDPSPTPTPAPPSPLEGSSHKSPPPLLLALSGPTSSGKTSLATALHAIYPPPHSVLIHADDFYKRDDEIPFVELSGGALDRGEEEEEGGCRRVRDWDCAGALDLGALEGVVRGLKGRDWDGEGEEGLDGEGVGMVRQGNFEAGEGGGGVDGIPPSLIARLRSSTTAPLPPPHPTLIILDGFLLFGASVPRSLTSLFDIKILLRATREKARERRERRNGYVTLEGFWEDPEGYFEGVVWPGYEREYGGVEGRVGGGGGWFDEEEGVWCSDPEWGLERCLEWVVGVVRGVVEEKGREGDAVSGA